MLSGTVLSSTLVGTSYSSQVQTQTQAPLSPIQTPPTQDRIDIISHVFLLN